MEFNIYNGSFKITSVFGNRVLANGDNRFHKGIDYVGITNKNLIAITDGIVLSSQIITDKINKTWEYGNYIIIDDGHGYTYRYCHLSKRLVNKGDKIKKGQVIGIEGATGYSFGSHCHFEVRNSENIAIDPNEYYKILNDREEQMEEVKRYASVSEMPEWMKPYVLRWITKGYIKGDGNNLNLSEDMVRTMVVCERMIGGQ